MVLQQQQQQQQHIETLARTIHRGKGAIMKKNIEYM